MTVTRPKATGVTPVNAFQLSRIYAQGWNAAKKLLADGDSDVHSAHAADLNPHRLAEQAARWTKGFEEALQSRTGGGTVAKPGAWRPTGGE